MTQLEELLPLVTQLAERNDERKSLADLAAEDGRSMFHLQRVFSAELGESPLQFSRRVRLQRAAADLLVSEKTILDVALDAGFDSHEGFTRAFRSRFDMSPRSFRNQIRKFQYDLKNREQHLRTVSQTAPCVALYRVSTKEPLNPIGGRDMSIAYEVNKKTISETPFLFMQKQVKPEAVSEALASMLVPVFQFATEKGVPFAGPPTARYLSFGPGLLTIAAGMPVEHATEVEGEVKMGVLPAGLVASTLHKGPYDSLNQAHEAVQVWMMEHNLEAAGAPWEVYITDPGEVPDPAEWITEIVHPLKEA